MADEDESHHHQKFLFPEARGHGPHEGRRTRHGPYEEHLNPRCFIRLLPVALGVAPVENDHFMVGDGLHSDLNPAILGGHIVRLS